jgi:uncharacterized membrane protein required for colicin V production
MSFPEISLLVLAALPIFYRAWSGWRYGASVELRYLLTFFFAVLVATRYWQPVTETLTGAVTFEPRLIALVAFLALFAAGAAVAGFAVDLRSKFYQSVKANYVDNVLGLAAGLCSGVLLSACILWVSTIVMPGKFESVPHVKSLCGLPGTVVGAIETGVGVAPDSAGRTRYPVVTMVDVKVEDSSVDVPEGSVLMRKRGKIDWK